MKLNNVDKIYVCHYTPLVDRMSLLNDMMKSYDLDYEVVTKFDREDLDEDLLNQFPNIRNPLNIPGHSNRTLRMSEISLIFKHLYIIKDMLDKGLENVLVLEDDIIFVDNFINKFNEYISDLPSDYDLLWVGTCCGIKSRNIRDNKHIYDERGSRCTHAYLISNRCAKKIVNEIYNVNYPADFMYNYLIDKFNLNNYWMEPSLINQNPMWDTTIQNDRDFI